ncbi:hypothetical protein RsTz2092_10690 [Deferribacterales bacterium RsTz2092]|nr:hypothetical protein AGMMS49941_09000 [Deferribacterales bacterium]
MHLSIAPDGVHLANPSSNISVCERASYRGEGSSLSWYKSLAKIAAGGEFVDSDVQSGVRYVYRCRNFDARYNVYSEESLYNVVFSGTVKVNGVQYELTDKQICVSVDASIYSKYVNITINGQLAGKYSETNRCFVLPNVANILLVAVPYSDSDTAGVAWSATIARDLRTLVLPPQNIRVLRNKVRTTVSWDRVAGTGTTYRIYTKDRVINTTASIISLNPPPNECVSFSLSSVRGGRESEKVSVESCP